MSAPLPPPPTPLTHLLTWMDRCPSHAPTTDSSHRPRAFQAPLRSAHGRPSLPPPRSPSRLSLWNPHRPTSPRADAQRKGPHRKQVHNGRPSMDPRRAHNGRWIDWGVGHCCNFLRGCRRYPTPARSRTSLYSRNDLDAPMSNGKGGRHTSKRQEEYKAGVQKGRPKKEAEKAGTDRRGGGCIYDMQGGILLLPRLEAPVVMKRGTVWWLCFMMPEVYRYMVVPSGITDKNTKGGFRFFFFVCFVGFVCVCLFCLCRRTFAGISSNNDKRQHQQGPAALDAYTKGKRQQYDKYSESNARGRNKMNTGAY